MNCIDLFCGCGGLSLGFINAGHKILSAYDNWLDALTVYKGNFSHPCIQIDLGDIELAISEISKWAPEMIIGGPPCQDFSSAGMRNEDNGRGDLTISFAEIVAKVKPSWVVMENVARITKTRKLQQATYILHNAGYGLTQVVLDACRCGVPQKRKRFFLIGKIGVSDGFMSSYLDRNLAKTDLTVADALGDMINLQFYYRHPRSYARRGIFSVNEPSPTIRGVNRPIPDGYKIHKNDPVDDIKGVRALTSKERSLIQTFPIDFVFEGSKTSQEQMIGNAVPVKLGQYVAQCINEYIKDNPD